MNFQCIDDVKGGIVLYTGIDSTRTPAPSLNSSREKIESNLLVYQNWVANEEFSPHLDNL